MGAKFERVTQQELNVHIFTASAQLVGVCLTVVGVFRLVFRLRSVDGVADHVLGVDAMAFLGACVLAYASLRSRTMRRRRALERVADVFFGAALVMMAAVCSLVAWQLL
jgi:hypothetical protein